MVERTTNGSKPIVIIVKKLPPSVTIFPTIVSQLKRFVLRIRLTDVYHFSLVNRPDSSI